MNECKTPCNLCGSRDIDVLSLKDRDGKYLRTVICKDCGLVWSDPRPGEAEVRKYYTEDYRLQYKKTYQPKPKHIFRACKVALVRYGIMKHVLKPGDKVLDVGSGGGEFLYILKKMGYAVEGIEPSEGYSGYSRKEYGLNVHYGFMQDMKLAKGSFDVVTMFHALEHTEDPLSVVQRLKSWVKPSGFLVIEVPNVEAICQSPGNRFHFAHFYNFNTKTLETMGKAAGLQMHGTTLSGDGANITMIFRNVVPAPMKDSRIPGNYDHIKSAVQRHTVLAHYMSFFPYSRLIAKLAKLVREKKGTSGVKSGKEIIDGILKSS